MCTVCSTIGWRLGLRVVKIFKQGLLLIVKISYVFIRGKLLILGVIESSLPDLASMLPAKLTPCAFTKYANSGLMFCSMVI